MKKTLLALALAAGLSGGAQATQYFDQASLSFSAASSTAEFMFSWVDRVVTNTKQNTVTESNGHYSLMLSNSNTGEVVFSANNISYSGDVGGLYSGSFNKTFNVQAGSNYTLTFNGLWSGAAVNANRVLTLEQSVSIAAVPEPESYAMFLAGLGIMGMIAKRRKNA